MTGCTGAKIEKSDLQREAKPTMKANPAVAS